MNPYGCVNQRVYAASKPMCTYRVCIEEEGMFGWMADSFFHDYEATSHRDERQMEDGGMIMRRQTSERLYRFQLLEHVSNAPEPPCCKYEAGQRDEAEGRPPCQILRGHVIILPKGRPVVERRD